MKRISIAICFLFMIINTTHAEVYPVLPEELAKESDLIVLGNVSGIEEAGETVKADYNDYDIPVKYATITVEETIKGKAVLSVIVKYAYDKGMEADVQDPDMEQEKKVLLYLQSNKDERGSYSVVYGWSGVCRFYEGKFYHQYFEKDFDKYIKELKSIVLEQKEVDLVEKFGLSDVDKILISNNVKNLNYIEDDIIITDAGVLAKITENLHHCNPSVVIDLAYQYKILFMKVNIVALEAYLSFYKSEGDYPASFIVKEGEYFGITNALVKILENYLSYDPKEKEQFK